MNAKDLLRPIANRIRRCAIAHRENASATVEDKLNARTIERDILLLSHSLEKGMGIPDACLGFGKAKAQQLISLLGVARHRGVSHDSFALAEGKRVLLAWRDWQEERGVDLSDIDYSANCLNDALDAAKSGNAGAIAYKRILRGEEEKKLALGFMESRRSVRWFTDREVDESILENVVQSALCAPSACNRQPCKVYFAKGESAAVVANEVRGNRGFESSIHQFAVVTCDRAMFSGAEIYQWYVNGGIFLYSLLLSFHANNIDSCVFQWLAGDIGAEMRTLLSIPEREAIVGVIGFGYPHKDAKVLAAQRVSPQEIISFHQ